MTVLFAIETVTMKRRQAMRSAAPALSDYNSFVLATRYASLRVYVPTVCSSN